MEEELRQLARVGRSWSVGELARRIECDTGLRSVRDDETNLWLLSKSHESLILRIRIEGAADDVDTSELVYSLTVLTALKVHVIEAVLTVKPVNHAALNWLNDNDRAVEVGLLIHIVDNPVDKSTKEVALTKLDNSLGHHALRSGTLI